MSSLPVDPAHGLPADRTPLRKHILLVEDDETVRLMMKRVLSARGFGIDEAPDGRQALARIREMPFDLVITDLVMPELEGLEVIRALRRESPSIAILAVSGAYGGAFLHAAELLGARAILAKPFNPEILVATVERLLARPP
jgi:DNA-binding response OmpR family regulator